MKCLYLGPILDSNSGYAKACIEGILSLKTTNIEVVARSIKMTQGTAKDVPEGVWEAIGNDLNDIDIVVQHNLPSEFSCKGSVLNVGTFSYETDKLPTKLWEENLKLMNNVYISSSHQKKVLKKYGIESEVIPFSTNINKFKRKYEKLDFDYTQDSIKFYTIGEFARRKNLTALITAYTMEFSSEDNALLVIKSSNREGLKKLVNEIRSGCNRFNTESNRYPRIVLITDYITEDDISSIHQSCDIFVSASYGEAPCLPFIDAMGFGNPTVVPKHTSFEDYSQDSNLFIDCVPTNIVGVANAPSGLYNSDEMWYNVSVPSLRNKMRYSFNNIKKLKELGKFRQKYIKNYFSRNAIGEKMKDFFIRSYNG